MEFQEGVLKLEESVDVGSLERRSFLGTSKRHLIQGNTVFWSNEFAPTIETITKLYHGISSEVKQIVK